MEERQYYEGECFGGPLHGQRMRVRFPKGFLCVDKANQKAWLYRFNDEDQFHASAEMMLSNDKRALAAEDNEWDVVSV
jgi:hypothetical protein